MREHRNEFEPTVLQPSLARLRELGLIEPAGSTCWQLTDRGRALGPAFARAMHPPDDAAGQRSPTGIDD